MAARPRRALAGDSLINGCGKPCQEGVHEAVVQNRVVAVVAVFCRRGRSSDLRRDRGRRVIVAIVTFRLPERRSLEEMTRVFESTAPKYLNLRGLMRKNYFVSEDRLRAGGIYVWESRAHAEAFYSPDWRQFVTGKYGAAPEIVYLDSPIMVDNARGEILPAAREIDYLGED